MLSILGKRQTKQQRQPQGEQPVFPGAICCMLAGESWVDEQGDERRHLCAAPATTAWHISETLDGASVTVGVPLCAEHAETYRAAAAPNGATHREVYPAGTFARWQAEAQEQAQEIVDTLMATIAERLTADLGASEAQVKRVFQACGAALHRRETDILKPQMAVPQKSIKRDDAVKATQPVQLV